MLLLLPACGLQPPPEDSTPVANPDVAWTDVVPDLDETSPQGRRWRRAIIHLHSPYSHDACDNHEGELDDETCGQDLRDGLCADAIDFAFLTDHPAYAAEQTYEDLLRVEEGDEVLDGVASRMTCPSGHQTTILPGIEDELMPVGLDRHVADTPEENDAIYNAWSTETIVAEQAAGATVLQAHTEGKTLADLQERVDGGLSGVELFNLHAMVDPTKREEDLGLDAYGYLDAIAPFITNETDAQPDLGFLAIYEEQAVSIEKLDTLNSTSFVVATAGTDAHENSLPMSMSDGERVDSYRRMMRWFSNILLVDTDAPDDAQAAIAAGRSFVAFEILGTPSGFDVHYGDAEMGGEVEVGGRLEVSCPTLAADTPQQGDPPEISVHVYKDGAIWQEGCGEFQVDSAGVYRVRVDIVPTHLTGFLDQETGLIHSYPWLYSNPFRVVD